MKILKWIIASSLVSAGLLAHAQQYTVNENAHSHNDYLQKQPFYTAYANRFASIEIDVFLKDDSLYVAHYEKDIKSGGTIQRLYLQPLMEQIARNDGKVYPEGGQLQFLIDLKTKGEPTLRALEEQLRPIRKFFDRSQNPDAVRLVISGDMPEPARFQDYDPIFFFDGRPNSNYDEEQLKRVAFYSAPFQAFSVWNGLGRITAPEWAKVKHFVDSVHALGKPVRFWGCPDTKTTWQAFIKLGVDYLNTDSPNALASFLNKYEANSYTRKKQHEVYQPNYRQDGAEGQVKRVILLISDGAGFSQQWAAATVNGGNLNMTQFRHIGFQNTAPTDDYNTDSAAGATAFATGKKTRNRYIGNDSSGRALPNLPEKLAEDEIPSAILTNDRITGATPSSFFAHQSERDHSAAIAYDILNSPVRLFIGGSHPSLSADSSKLKQQLLQKGTVIQADFKGLEKLPLDQQVICFAQDDAAKEYHMLEEAFDVALRRMDNQGDRFFIMLEGAKIDGGGHSNKIAQCIEEYLSFDRLLGKALQYADAHEGTLVVVTSDHETGGLVLVDGDYKKGFVLGEFITNDHTGAPIPVYSYGTGAQRFTGFMQNSDIGERILDVLSAQQ
ncbi:alkaline phosphatase [Olivibacter sp. SDN3]|uniref:alkaline phosphatase n=1 Tax=Olivibacter sp. SDN3 TaxID=2764720 RepID=UPI0016515BA5|nr:alkaline phosphatase [Olivibacter sp. SDN3]QNL51045.1 alkaline phosphatase [Olivibacter sp. SDN3]